MTARYESPKVDRNALVRNHERKDDDTDYLTVDGIFVPIVSTLKTLLRFAIKSKF